MIETEQARKSAIDPDKKEAMSLSKFSRAIGMDMARFHRDYLQTGKCTIQLIPGTEFAKRHKILASPSDIQQIRGKIHPSKKSI